MYRILLMLDTVDNTDQQAAIIPHPGTKKRTTQKAGTPAIHGIHIYLYSYHTILDNINHPLFMVASTNLNICHSSWNGTAISIRVHGMD